MNYPHFNTESLWSRWLSIPWRQRLPTHLPRLLAPDSQLPGWVRQCEVTRPLIEQFRLLDWELLPVNSSRRWFGHDPVPLAAYVGSYLVKLAYGLPTMGTLRRFLVSQPALVWTLGFPLIPGSSNAHGFDPQASVPSQRQLSRMMSQMPNEALQSLLTGEVTQLQDLLPAIFGQTVSLDTKHILAWVKQNNPKSYLKEGRWDKTQQPKGDPDCKLGCKRRHNRQTVTPTAEGKAASQTMIGIGEFYWGYASGVVATKVPGWGEFVLAEMTQTFDKSDVSYFFPLMAQTEQRLGFRPPYAALDAAFDAFYVYDYFHSQEHDGFAAVPFSEKGGHATRQFDADGSPLCEAGLSMPLKFTYQDNTTALIPYRRAKYVCPLLFPQPIGRSCPINHKKWPAGGCATSLADTPGAHIRHQLDRDSDLYNSVYAQRTAVERIFSQALNLGIERPKLRNQQAIANLNSLIYILINLRALHRVLTKQQDAHD
jgi:hypothetical protein